MAHVTESLMVSVNETDTSDIDLCNPRWRVAPQDWFSDKDEHEPDSVFTVSLRENWTVL